MAYNDFKERDKISSLVHRCIKFLKVEGIRGFDLFYSLEPRLKR